MQICSLREGAGGILKDLIGLIGSNRWIRWRL